MYIHIITHRDLLVNKTPSTRTFLPQQYLNVTCLSADNFYWTHPSFCPRPWFGRKLNNQPFCWGFFFGPNWIFITSRYCKAGLKHLTCTAIFTKTLSDIWLSKLNSYSMYIKTTDSVYFNTVIIWINSLIDWYFFYIHFGRFHLNIGKPCCLSVWGRYLCNGISHPPTMLITESGQLQSFIANVINKLFFNFERLTNR